MKKDYNTSEKNQSLFKNLFRKTNNITTESNVTVKKILLFTKFF